jgi:hypothetical protein
MKKVLIALVVALTFVLAAPVVAKEKMASLGLSFNLPYVVSPSPTARGPFTMDLLGEYYINQNFALNLMFQFQFEMAKAMFIDPGVRYYFTPEKTWSPYVQMHVILGIKDAGPTGNMNYGFRIGPGINFDLSELTGLEGLNTFFDIDFTGLFKSTRVWSIEVFRLGFSYAF